MMIMPSEMVLPLRTVSGAGHVAGLLTDCFEFGRRGVLVYGRSLAKHGILARVLSAGLSDETVLPWRHSGGEPTLNQVEVLLAAARAHGAEWIAAIGGGSVLDVAKAAAGLMDAPLGVGAYYGGEPIEPSRTPFIAVPTTAGTGSEATMVSVLTDPEQSIKRSIRHPSFMARLVVLDPELLRTCPSSVIAASGMDALTQAVEAYASRKATAFTDAVAMEAIGLIERNLLPVYEGSGGLDAAGALLQGSYLAGIALSGARLGVVHGLAHPLGVRYALPHGLACALGLLPTLKFNREAMGEKFNILNSLMGGDALSRIAELMEALNIQSPLHGKAVTGLEAIIEETLASGSTAANPRDVTAADVEALLSEMFSV